MKDTNYLVLTVALTSALILGGCSSSTNRTLGGAAIGAGAGAGISAISGGDVGTGAVVGGAVGAAAGALTR